MTHRLPYYGAEEKKKIHKRILGFLESDSKYATVANILLGTVSIGSILVIGAVAPNLMQILGKGKKYRRKFSERQVRNAITNLNEHGFVKILKNKNNSTEILLTTKGEERIRTFCLSKLLVEKQKKWDKKWRVVAFDIPVERNLARRALRNKMKDIGFYQLQKSVWIHPYPCEDELLFIAHIFGVENCINLLTVERLLHEDKLRKIFDL